ncbi:MAG: hypothetical protein KAS90_02900 [Candidatus Aenigmarchaeota archaeon]|nr:hypothetical protein [Candidatus Aenigmarchaeota archaeon]
MSKKKVPDNHNPHTQLYKNWITWVSANHIENIFGFYQTHNVNNFRQFFTDISEGTLCPYDSNQQNILSFEPANLKSPILDGIYKQITHETDILPKRPICPDFLNISQACNSINMYEMKAKMQKKGGKISSISMNFEQVIKYGIQTKKWASDLNIKSDLMIICYLYTLDKEIGNINSIPEVAEHLHINDIVLIPYDYIKEYNPNFARKIEKFGLDIEKIEQGNTTEINRLKRELKNNTKNNSTFFSISGKEIQAIINQDIPNTYQKTIKSPAEIIKTGKNNSIETQEQDITFTCAENGTKLGEFFREITGNFANIKDTGINSGLLKSFNFAGHQRNDRYSTKKISQFS